MTGNRGTTLLLPLAPGLGGATLDGMKIRKVLLNDFYTFNEEMLYLFSKIVQNFELSI